jgi:hypothetical protein
MPLKNGVKINLPFWTLQIPGNLGYEDENESLE